MIRRSVVNGGTLKNGIASPGRKSSGNARTKLGKSPSEPGVSSATLLLIAILLTFATWLFPDSEMTKIERDAEHLAQRAEQDLIDLWAHKGSNAASAKMQNHGSKWVDGEKKLKLKLKELAKRQEQGLDLGVPVLTRYLGEDIPAWPDETISKDDWTAKVKAKYAEMQQEEVEWKAKISAALKSEHRG